MAYFFTKSVKLTDYGKRQGCVKHYLHGELLKRFKRPLLIQANRF